MYLVSRLRVALIRFAARFLNFPMPFTFVGPDSSLSLCADIADAGIGRLTLVTDDVLFKLGVLDRIVQALSAAGVEVDVYSGIEPDPGYESVIAGVKGMRRHQTQAVLAVGGGSVIDGAKVMLACSTNNDAHPSEVVGAFKVMHAGMLPFYAVPTTAGTGSEVTIGAVISDKATQQKLTVVDPKLVPIKIALDPTLMLGLPPAITAATGIDALAHVVESYIGALATPATDRWCLEAAASIVRNLPLAYANGSDLRARERMSVAAYVAGLAVTRAGVGYVHAISHQLGGLYHVPHGLANAIVMPYVLEASKSACAPRLAQLARACGLSQIGEGDMVAAERFIEHLRRMNRDMNIPERVSDLRRQDFDKIIDRAFKEAHGTYGIPKYFSRGECAGLLEKLLVTA